MNRYESHTSPGLRICIFGAALDTGNLGVSALSLSIITGLLEREPNAHITLFDHGLGARRASVRVGDVDHPVHLLGARHSKRYHRGDTLAIIRLAGKLGGLGNPAIRAIRGADAVLDISAGDSFTDMYGPRVFQTICMPKTITLEQGTPLILMPQTYGPYSDPEVRRKAEELLRAAAEVWSRDEHSFTELEARLGDAFDPARHLSGVDVAFGLTPVYPEEKLSAPVKAWLSTSEPSNTVGFNVSGLIHNDPDWAAKQLGIAIDYREATERILRNVLEESSLDVLLIPHVMAPPGTRESDNAACEAVAEKLSAEYEGRVQVGPTDVNAAEAKGVIARCAWFCGTRMHSTIAGLSTGVPTATIAYSGKAIGVFESIGQGDHVSDARTLSTEQTVRQVIDSFERRDETRTHLAEAWRPFQERVTAQMDQIVATCRRLGTVRKAG